MTNEGKSQDISKFGLWQIISWALAAVGITSGFAQAIYPKAVAICALCPPIALALVFLSKGGLTISLSYEQRFVPSAFMTLTVPSMMIVALGMMSFPISISKVFQFAIPLWAISFPALWIALKRDSTNFDTMSYTILTLFGALPWGWFAPCIANAVMDAAPSPQNSHYVKVLRKWESHGRRTAHMVLVEEIPGKLPSQAFGVSAGQYRKCEPGSLATIAVTPGGLGMPRALFVKPTD